MKSSQPIGLSLRIGDLVSIYQRGQTWYANYQLSGKQHRPSLRTKIKKEAISRAERLERDLQVGNTPRKLVRVAISHVYAEFLEDLKSRDRAKDTITHYRRALRALQELMDERRLNWVSQIDYPLIDAFRQRERKRVSAGTVYTYLNVIRSLVLFALRQRYLETDPLPKFKNKKPKPTQQPCWSWDQVQEILALVSEDYRPLLECLAYTGMRIGEAIHLQPADIDNVNHVIHIRPKPGWKPKSGDERIVPIAEELASNLNSLNRKNRWVFVSPTMRGRAMEARVSAKSALAELRRALEKLGLPGRLHTFRHAFISHALTSGRPEATVRSWVGHVDAAIIRRYTHVADQISQSQMKGLFSRDSSPRAAG